MSKTEPGQNQIYKYETTEGEKLKLTDIKQGGGFFEQDALVEEAIDT